MLLSGNVSTQPTVQQWKACQAFYFNFRRDLYAVRYSNVQRLRSRRYCSACPYLLRKNVQTCNSKYFNNRKGKPVMNNLKKFTSASFLMLAVLWLTASFHPASAQSIPPLGAASSFAVLGGTQ